MFKRREPVRSESLFRNWRGWLAHILILGTAACDGGGRGANEEPPVGDIPAGPVPSSEALFVSEGAILTPDPGEWDARFDDGSAGTIVEKNGSVFLYYIGADGDRASDGGPAHRKLGVATASSLSRPWTKHASNPILEHSPNDDEEEGFWRICAMVDDDGTILLYATVLTGSGGKVRGDIQLFTSTDGVNFTAERVVLAHDDEQVFGSGDELGALGIYKATDDRYHLYYTAKAPDINWVLGHASGPTRDTFTDSEEAYAPGFEVGHGSNPILIDGTVFIPVQDNSGAIEIHATTEAALGTFGAIAASYPSLATDMGSLYLRDRWYLIASNDSEGMGPVELHTAAAVTSSYGPAPVGVLIGDETRDRILPLPF